MFPAQIESAAPASDPVPRAARKLPTAATVSAGSGGNTFSAAAAAAKAAYNEQLIDIDVHIVEIAERGHRPHFAVRKEFRQFVLRRQPDMFAVQRLFQPFEVDSPCGGDDRHHKPLVGFDDHYFGKHVAGDVKGLSRPL